MKTTWKMSLVLLSMLFFAGLTACDQADKVIDDAAETAKQAVDTAKEKAAEVLGATEDESSEEDFAEKEEGEEDSNSEYFVHVTGLIDRISEGDVVEFELKEGKKGLNAVNVKLA